MAVQTAISRMYRAMDDVVDEYKTACQSPYSEPDKGTRAAKAERMERTRSSLREGVNSMLDQMDEVFTGDKK